MPKEALAVPGGVVHFGWHTSESGQTAVSATYAPDITAWQAALTSALTSALTAALAGSSSGAKLDLLLAKVEKLEVSITDLKKQGTAIVADLTALKQEVSDTVGAEQSALVLIQGIEAQLANATSQADIDSLTQQLGTERAALAAAVGAPGTPPAAPAAAASA